MSNKPLVKLPMSDKTPAMRNFIESVFPGTKAAIASRHCPCCGNPITNLRDELSRREFRISGMCQSCQNSVFGDYND